MVEQRFTSYGHADNQLNTIIRRLPYLAQYADEKLVDLDAQRDIQG